MLLDSLRKSREDLYWNDGLIKETKQDNNTNTIAELKSGENKHKTKRLEDGNGELKHATTRRAKGHQSLEMSGVVAPLESSLR